MPKRPGPGTTTRGKQMSDLDALSFGQTLHNYRTQSSLSQGQLAEKLDRSVATVSLLETGARRPTSDFVELIAGALGFAHGSKERNALQRAAGFQTDDLSGLLRRLTDSVAERFQIGESQRLVIAADVSAVANGWVDYFTSQNKFNQGLFGEVADYCETTLTHKHLSPTLQTHVLILQASAMTHLGDGEIAEQLAETAAANAETGLVAPDAAAAVLAEVESLRGLIAAEQGKITRGETLLNKAITGFQNLLRARKSPASVPDNVAYIGIGSSYKRLAQIALLRGMPEQGFTYCLTAESYLNRAGQTTETIRWARRTRELKAWAYSRLEDYDEALKLREETRQELSRAKDTYGLARNWLYTGNDYLSRIRSIIRSVVADRMASQQAPAAEPGQERSESERAEAFSLRADATCEALQREDVAQYLDSAKQLYVDALAQFDLHGPQTLRAKCMLNLASILRYKALRNHGDDAASSDAQALLVSALSLETRIGHPPRIAAVYEALGNLYSDKGDLASAHSYYAKGLEALDNYTGVSRDPAVVKQRGRIYTMAREVEARIKQHDDTTRASTYGPVNPADELQKLGNQLTDLASQLVLYLEKPDPIEFTNRADDWCKIIHDLEVRPGGRRVLQRGLSDSLAQGVLAGVTPDGAGWHGKRFAAFMSAIESATDSYNRNEDYCCRPAVQADLAAASTAVLTLPQIEQALKWMTKFSNGYMLHSGEFEPPLAFYVKGSDILFEIPRTLAKRFINVEGESLSAGTTLCYAIKSESGADALRQLFDEYVRAARTLREQVGVTESTESWLQRLLDSQLAASGSGAGRYTSGK